MDMLEQLQALQRTIIIYDKKRIPLTQKELYKKHLRDCPNWREFITLVEGLERIGFITQLYDESVGDTIILYNKDWDTDRLGEVG